MRLSEVVFPSDALRQRRFEGGVLDRYDNGLSYSLYLRKRNGARCRIYKKFIPGTMEVLRWNWQWCHDMPGEYAGGSWSFIKDCDLLTLACFLEGCTVDPCQADKHPGPEQKDPDNELSG
jgi:hypothetical protein